MVMGFQLLLLSCVFVALLFLGAIKGVFVGNVSIVLGTYIPGPICCLSNLLHHTYTHTHTHSSPTHTHILTLAVLPHIHTYSHLQFSLTIHIATVVYEKQLKAGIN